MVTMSGMIAEPMSSIKMVQTGIISDLSIARAANINCVQEGNEWRYRKNQKLRAGWIVNCGYNKRNKAEIALAAQSAGSNLNNLPT
jgi:hypothetical protein